MLHVWFATPSAFFLLLLGVPMVALAVASIVPLRRSALSPPGLIRRQWTVLGFRLATLLCLTAAIANPLASLPSDTLDVMFVADQSGSVARLAPHAAANWISEALKSRAPGDQAGLVVFGKTPAVVTPMGPSDPNLAELSAPSPGAQVDGTASNIGQGLAFADGQLWRHQGRVVLLSDGQENVGDAVAAARAAQQEGLQVDVVPLDTAMPEVAAEGIITPAKVRENEWFSYSLTVQSNVNTTAHVQVLTDGQPSAVQNVTVRPGSNQFVFGQAPLGHGYHTLSATIDPQLDTVADNNRADTAVEVVGAPQVLLAEGAPDDGRWLADALTTNGIDVRRVPIASATLTTVALRPYDVVILANVPSSAISPTQVGELQSYVQDLGGGLIVAGGDMAFGAGGYSQSKLDDLLPLTSQRHKTPAVAVDLVIDDSGSMAEDGSSTGADQQPHPAADGQSKLDYAKQAAKLALGAIQPGDEIGLLAFNSSLSWLAPRRVLTSPQDSDYVQGAISGIQAGGGTDIDAALTSAYHDLQDSTAKTRAIVLLTDGQPTNGEVDPKVFANLASDIGDSQISISTIAIGADADVNLLQTIANGGNGRAYTATSPDQVPSILFDEARRVDPPAIVDRELTPVLTGSGYSAGLSATGALPHLLAYDAVTAKPLALVSMKTDDGDPLLAQWQLGLGQVVAWASDARNRWSAQWLGQPVFGVFWSQVVHNALAGQIDSNLQSTVDLQGAGATLTVNALGPDGRPRNGADTQALVVGPDGRRQQVALQQAAPGQYTGTLPADQRGVYVVSVTQTQQGKVVAAQISSYGVGSSPEYRAFGADRSKLEAIAAAGGGSVLNSPAEAFQHQVRSTSELPLWPALVIAAMVLFLAEIGTRRFGFSTLLLFARRRSQAYYARVRPKPAPPPEAGDLGFRQEGEEGEAPVEMLVP